MRDFLIAVLLGTVLDWFLGDPAWLRHPVCFIGSWISFAEKRLRARGGNLRHSAVLLTASTVLLTGVCVFAIVCVSGLFGRPVRILVMALLDWMGLAEKSLRTEAEGVAGALSRSLEDGRKQVARIVGRDTQSLSESEVICAAVETVAENTTDGVISPLLFGAVSGPVGMWMFKAASTLDSMLGYMDERWRDIGWSSAKLDDVLNYLPARLTGFLLCAAAAVCGLDGKNALRIVLRDHACHASPNCAWSEAAAAGALHIRLGGTHDYFGKPMVKPTIGDDNRPPETGDIAKTCRMMLAAECFVCAALVLILIF